MSIQYTLVQIFIFVDGPDGAFQTDQIHYDMRPDEIDALPNSAPHREIDLAIVTGQRELGESAKIAIMIRKLAVLV